jgi:hypothetical protein
MKRWSLLVGALSLAAAGTLFVHGGSAYANCPASDPNCMGGGGTPPPSIVVIQPSPQPQPQPQVQYTPRPPAPPRVQTPSVSGESFLPPDAQSFVDQPAPATPGPQVELGAAPTTAPAPTPSVAPPPASDTSSSNLPMTPIAAGLAAVAGVALLAGLRRRPDACEAASAAVVARCGELRAATEQMRVAGQRHDSVNATLGTALAEPSAHIADGPLAPALRSLRRERHHARDQLMWTRSQVADAQRRYDEARAAVPPNCGTCPPCESAARSEQSLTATSA